MQLNHGLGGISTGATILVLIAHAQPAWAVPTDVTAVRLNRSASGVEVVLDTQGNTRPQVFTVNKGNSAVADITNTRLRLPSGNSFRQVKPAPGIASVAVNQLDANTIRVVVNGTTKAPTGQLLRRNGSGLVLGFRQAPDNETNPAPPRLPRAVAPPVGDIAVAPVDVAPDAIDLGTSKLVPKLLLREAPAREVLTLLARAAGLNLAFNTQSSTDSQAEPSQSAAKPGTNSQTQQSSGTVTSEEPRISLDVENESIQNIFNYVLWITGLQANRVGQTIFVGKTLPGEAQNRIVRTYRLNQIKATASGTITQVSEAISQTGGSVGGTSASAEVDEDDATFSLSGGTTGSLAASSINRATTTNENATSRGAKEILESYGANSSGTGDSGNQETSDPKGQGTGNGGNEGASRQPSSTLLSGLEVIADARANSVTLIGSPRMVNIATDLLRQMDLRRRQAAVSIKIVDVDLTKSRTANASLQYGAGVGSAESITASFVNGFFQIGAPIGADFLLNILGRIRDDDAKILTSPTVMVQEGSSAQVNLTQEIFSGVTTRQETVGEATRLIQEPIIRPAGVILNMSVDRIDDNGFITLNISPEVSAPSGTFEVAGEEGTLLQQRRLETGQIRLRDGQTLVLTGIIQDEDRVTTDKVPILGDIPLLGRLFRRDVTSRTRQELVIVVTPRILNDSDESSFGYQYKPGPEVEKMLNPQGQ